MRAKTTVLSFLIVTLLSSNALMIQRFYVLNERMANCVEELGQMRAQALSDAANKSPLWSPCSDAVTVSQASGSNQGVKRFKVESLLNIIHLQYPQLSQKYTYVLIIFMSPMDCPLCLQEAKVWAKLQGEVSAEVLQIVGIMSYMSSEEIKAMSQQLNIEFPVLSDVGGKLREGYGIAQSPYKVLLDARANIIAVDGASRSEAGHMVYYNKILRLIRKKPV